MVLKVWNPNQKHQHHPHLLGMQILSPHPISPESEALCYRGPAGGLVPPCLKASVLFPDAEEGVFPRNHHQYLALRGEPSRFRSAREVATGGGT